MENLIAYIEGLLQGQDPRSLYQAHEGGFIELEPLDIFRSFHHLLAKGYSHEEILQIVPKVILATQKYFPNKTVLVDQPFLQSLREENQVLNFHLDRLRPLLTEQEITTEHRVEMLAILHDLTSYRVHFSKQQNILFPMLMAKDETLSALSILWAWQDQAAKRLEDIRALLQEDAYTLRTIRTQFGLLFSSYASLQTKEERFLYPAAGELLDADDWQAINNQAKSYPLAFGLDAEILQVEENVQPLSLDAGELVSKTGTMDAKTLALVLRHLPLDFTVVDANDRLIYFSDSPDRVFPRSPAALGRLVKQCHPPKSYAKVEEIITAFKEGRQKHARFWIKVREKTILIEYFSLLDTAGTYCGVLEVSQDITDFIGITGEKRLASWEA